MLSSHPPEKQTLGVCIAVFLAFAGKRGKISVNVGVLAPQPLSHLKKERSPYFAGVKKCLRQLTGLRTLSFLE